jgi:ribulose-phosphate 3-epimerase
VNIKIAPSILSANFAALKEDIRKVEEAGAQLLHIDVMDGHFVPNITIGPVVLKSIRKVTGLPLDVHLMISDPDKYIPAFVDAGADMITVHTEATVHLDRTLNFIRSHKVGVGVSINPATPVSTIQHVFELIDMLLVMSVNPGFGGQKFIPYSLEKIRQARKIIDEKKLACVIEVDGGIDTPLLPQVVNAGASVLVVGSAIFGQPDAGAKVKEMLESVATLGYHSNYV